MRVVALLQAWGRGDVRSRQFDRIRSAGIDAYDLVDELPRGPARLAAWNAYVLQTYGDKLLGSGKTTDYVRRDTAIVAQRLYQLSAVWIEQARQIAFGPERPVAAAPPEPLPHWHTPVRSQEELTGMRSTLDALRVYLAFELERFAGSRPSIAALREHLARIDAKIETVDGLWLRRAPDELRGGIGDALSAGLDSAYALGQLLAQPELHGPLSK